MRNPQLKESRPAYIDTKRVLITPFHYDFVGDLWDVSPRIQ